MVERLSDIARKVGSTVPFDFKSFDRRTVPITTQPMATLQRGGLMSINRASFDALGSPAAVELLYDEKARAIALRAIDPKSLKAYGVRQQGTGKSYMLSATRLCSHHHIDTTESRRYQAIVEGDMLIFELDKSVGVVTGTRRKGGGKANAEHQRAG